MERKSIMIDMDEVIVKGRFTEFRNKKISREDLEKDNIIRVNNWLEIQEVLM